jgi:energy-coupling factor transporter ATP-binding protein EcfA2
MLNLYKPVTYNITSLEVAGKLKSYYLFSGVSSIDFEDNLFRSLSKLKYNFTYTLILNPNDQYKLKKQFQAFNVKDKEKELIGETKKKFDFVGDCLELLSRLNFIKNNLLEDEKIVKQNFIKAIDNEEKILTFGLLVCFEIGSQEVSKELKREVTALVGKMNINLFNASFIQNKIHKINNLKSEPKKEFLYYSEKHEIEDFNPVIYRTFKEPNKNSIFLGKITASNSPFWLNINFRKEDSNHILIIGTTGSGKSSLVKSLTKQLYNIGHRVIMVDPKNEYKEIADTIEDSFEIDAKAHKGINMFDLDAFNSLIDVTEMFVIMLEAITNTEINEEQKAELNAILHEVKKDKKDKKQSFIKKIESSKTLKSFSQAVQNESIVELLSSDQDKESISKITSRFIRFSFSGLEGKELILFVSILVRIINTLPFDRSIHTVICFDEASKFLSNTKTSKVITNLYRILRSMNISICSIEQDLREYGKTAQVLFSLSTHIFMFKHDPIEDLNIDKDLYQKISVMNKLEREVYYLDRDTNEGIFCNSIIPKSILPYI